MTATHFLPEPDEPGIVYLARWSQQVPRIAIASSGFMRNGSVRRLRFVVFSSLRIVIAELALSERSDDNHCQPPIQSSRRNLKGPRKRGRSSV